MLAERIGERNVKRYASLKASLEYIENVLRIGGFQSLDTGSGLKY